MAQPVSILDGEVNRNWHVVDSQGQKHLLTLFHDCVTGARAAMLDYEEVPGSVGTTNLFNLVAGRATIPFTIASTGENGHLSVLRRGIAGFSYECELNGRIVLDTTSVVQNTDYEYEVSIPASVDIGTKVSGVTWYEVYSKRKADGKGTLVHRRFRDFFALHDQVVSLMKGHHLRSSLPRFPEKKSKLWTNHGDMSFVEERRRALDLYVKTLLQLPHVSTLDSTRAFLGMVGNLREFSVVWEGKDLGLTLKRPTTVAKGKATGGNTNTGDGLGPPVITLIQGAGKAPPGVSPGDRLFRVNGESMEFKSLEAAWSSFKRASRPVILHFLGPIIRMDSTLAPLPEASLRHRGPEGRSGQSLLSEDDGGPPLAAGLLGHDGTAGTESQRGLGGITQMRWPAWRRPQSGGGTMDPVTGTGAAGVGRNRSSDRLPPGRSVGPFGDGAGASRSSSSSNSRLFGDSGNAGRDASLENQARAWRSSGGTGVAGLQSTVRPLGDKQGGTGSRRTSEWMPDVTIGAGSSNTNTSGAAASRWEATSQPRSAGSTLTSATGRHPEAPPKWLTGAGGSTTPDVIEGAHFGSRTSAMPQDRLNAPTGNLFNDNGAGRNGFSEERVGNHHHISGGQLAEGSMGRQENGKAGQDFVPSSFGGFRGATRRPAAFGDAAAVDEEEDDNPFA